MVNHSIVTNITVFCLSVFRFPLKLAVSAFVALVAIYHVSCPLIIIMTFHLINQTYYRFCCLPLWSTNTSCERECECVHLSDGVVVSRPRGSHSPYCPCWYRWKHRLPVVGVWDHPFRWQDGGRQNCDLLYLAARRYVGLLLALKKSPQNTTPYVSLLRPKFTFS